MEWVETTGKTLEEAKEAALDQLGVDEEEAEFEVVMEPRRGLFGWLGVDARVRARIRPLVPRPKEDRRERRRRGRERKRVRAASEGGRADMGGLAVNEVDRALTENRGGGELESSGVGGGDGNDELSVAEQAAIARSFVNGLMDAFGVSAAVSCTKSEDGSLELAITGRDLGLLIGPRGQTLLGIQELTRTAVQRRVSGRPARLSVDIAGYRRKRREALERFTREVAREVLATGKRKVLEPMPPPDRKIVHDTANEIPGVATSSEGEEPRRRVIISRELERH